MLKVAVVLLSAGAHALAFPPWDYGVLAFVCIAPFLVVLRRLTPWRAVLAGHLWGSAAIWGVAYWVADALTFYYEQPWWFGVLFCLVGCQILWGVYYALFAGSARTILPAFAVWQRPLITASLWVACELARARLLTGEPWMLLGYALVPNIRLIQAADFGGVYILSFCVLLVNASIAELVLAGAAERPRLAPRLAVAPLLAVVALLAYGTIRLRTPLPESTPLRVTVVQGNNDLGRQWREEFYGAGLSLYTDLSAQALRQRPADMLVWPESALTFFLAHEPTFQSALGGALRSLNTDLIVGAPHHDDTQRYFNSAFHMTADGRVTGRYDKVRLLPFAEYFPLRFIELLRRNFERVRYFTPGDGDTLLATRAGPVAVVICFEAIFPEIVRQRMNAGATLLVNLSNDVWLGRGVGQQQHLAMVVLRAVENRTWVVRATTTGISAMIDPRGRIESQTPLFAEATLAAEVAPLRIDTLYKRWGDGFAYACVALSLVAAGVTFARRRSGHVRVDESRSRSTRSTAAA